MTDGRTRLFCEILLAIILPPLGVFLRFGCCTQLMAMKSDAPFRDAKMKLLEIRSRLAKQNDGRTDTREERRKKKKQKKDSDGHAWSVVR